MADEAGLGDYKPPVVVKKKKWFDTINPDKVWILGLSIISIVAIILLAINLNQSEENIDNLDKCTMTLNQTATELNTCSYFLEGVIRTNMNVVCMEDIRARWNVTNEWGE